MIGGANAVQMAWVWCGTLTPMPAKANTISPEQSNPPPGGARTPGAPAVGPCASPPPHTYGVPTVASARAATAPANGPSGAAPAPAPGRQETPLTAPTIRRATGSHCSYAVG